MKIKLVCKIAGTLLACYLVYVLTGMLVPFVHQKTVSDVNQTFNREEYYSEGISVDRAAVVEDNNEALEERLRLIQNAKKQILLATFDMREGQSTRDMISALLDAANRGVDIKVLVDGLSGVTHMQGHSLFYAMSAHPNIEVRVYNSPNPLMPWTFNGRMHDKYIIADHTVMILGGRNMFDYFLGDYIKENKSYDRDLLVYNSAYDEIGNTDSVIYQTEDYFYKVWDNDVCKKWHEDETLLEDKDVAKEVTNLRAHFNSMKRTNPSWFEELSYEDITEETNRITLVSGETGIYGKEPLVWYQLTKLMEQAQEKVRIHTPYAVMGDEMWNDLRRVAQTKDTSVMINSVETGDNFMASADYLFHKADVLETGVTLREFVGDMSYHGKSIAIDDDIAVVGSYNMDLRSTYMDTELMLIVNSKAVNAKLQEIMDGYEAQAKQVVWENKKPVYEPDDLILEEMPWYKKAAMRVTGFVLQLVRFVV